MPYLLHKTCPDPVASVAAIPDEANCSWLHQSTCEWRQNIFLWQSFGDNKVIKTTHPNPLHAKIWAGEITSNIAKPFRSFFGWT